jgi:hypothetical protein
MSEGYKDLAVVETLRGALPAHVHTHLVLWEPYNGTTHGNEGGEWGAEGNVFNLVPFFGAGIAPSV